MANQSLLVFCDHPYHWAEHELRARQQIGILLPRVQFDVVDQWVPCRRQQIRKNASGLDFVSAGRLEVHHVVAPLMPPHRYELVAD